MIRPPERCVEAVQLGMRPILPAAARWPAAVYERGKDSCPETLWEARK
jgi:hypothetical protein